MILRKNQDLFNLIKALAGVNQFTTNEVTNLVDLTNRRLTTAYDSSPMWTRYVVASEERDLIVLRVSGAGGTDATLVNGDYKLNGTHNGASLAVDGSNLYLGAIAGASVDGTVVTGAVAYERLSDGAWVFATGASITSNADGTKTLTNAGTVRFLETDSPTKAFPFEVNTFQAQSGVGSTGTLAVSEQQFIPYEQTSENTIASFIRIHRKRAFLNDSSTEYEFFVDADGAHILNSSTTDGKAFVTYKKHIIDTSTGVIISSLDTDGSSGLQQIPLEFFQYTAHAVYADFLRLDGQHDKAAFEENKAGEFLAEELEKVDIINNKNSLNHKFTTHLNTSSR